jgi:hypothetical protein
VFAVYIEKNENKTKLIKGLLKPETTATHTIITLTSTSFDLINDLLDKLKFLTVTEHPHCIN